MAIQIWNFYNHPLVQISFPYSFDISTPSDPIGQSFQYISFLAALPILLSMARGNVICLTWLDSSGRELNLRTGRAG